MHMPCALRFLVGIEPEDDPYRLLPWRAITFGVEQVQNIVGNDNCERVRLSESERSEKRLIN